MTATTRRDDALDPDTVSALEEQRDFLLRSLEDLEAERAAGDIDDDDYLALRDDYTARAAAVLRRLEAGSSPGRSRQRARRRGRGMIVGGLVVLAALIAGFVVMEAAGRRDPGDGITGGGPESSRALLAQGDELLRGGDPEAAIAAYDEALAIDPQDVTVLLHRAAALTAKSDLDGASEMYAEVLALDPENLEALTYQAPLLDQQGDTEAALEQLDKAIALDPTFLDARGVKLAVLGAHDRLDEGLVEIEELAAGGDSDIALAVAQQSLSGNLLAPVDGLRVFDAVIAGDPDNALALTYRGWQPALFARGEGVSLDDQETLLEEALDFLDRAIAVDPELPDARAFRTIVLHQLDRDDEAAEELRAFDALNPPEEMRAIVDSSNLREELGVPAP